MSFHMQFNNVSAYKVASPLIKKPEKDLCFKDVCVGGCGGGEWKIVSLRASSPIWVSEMGLARTRERGAEERRACNDLS